MRLSERQINILVGGAVLLLLPVAWLQYRWIGEVSEADQQRRTTELKAALERISVDSDRDAGRLHATLIGPPGGDDFRLEDRIANYQAPEDAAPLLRIWRFRETDERWHAELWDTVTKTMKPVPAPEWWSGQPFRRGPIHAEPAAFLGPAFEDASGFIALELDERRVVEEYLPRLIRRHLGEGYLQDYSIRIVKASERTRGEASAAVFRRIQRGSPPPGPPQGWKKKKKKGGPPGLDALGDGIWRLEAQHQDGSLEAVVARTRTRNLALSFVTLLFLGMALAAIGYALRTSQRLARLQLEFTAGVSHELRTPLAVIVSAGDNLAGGYVKDPMKVREYGALVRDEGTRLTGMVDQVLRFSEFEAERIPMEKRALLVSDVMEQLEREMRPVAERQGCEWESAVENGAFSGDAAALHVAVRNLVENALRHGGGKWISVRAAKEGAEVVFSVEDRGSGISPADLPHLFEPFYRGTDSRAQQRKGSGLGLALVDRIARAHGGSVRGVNKADGGARFTLTIPNG
jgi:signal transduction histidine kinase